LLSPSEEKNVEAAKDQAKKGSNRKKRRERRVAGQTLFVGAPGEDALVHEVDHSRNTQDQTKEAALKASQSQKQLANAPKGEELKRKKP